MNAHSLKIQVILASIREGRFGDKPAEFMLGEAKKLAGVETELVDLRDYTLPFFASAVSPSRAMGEYGNSEVMRFAGKVSEADAYIIVTPEYNHGYPGALKNALDSIYGEWIGKPVAFVSYGGVGGARAVEQLRQVAVELQMAPIRNAVHISWDVYMAVAKAQAPVDPVLFAPIAKAAEALLTQLLWWGRALKAAREINS